MATATIQKIMELIDGLSEEERVLLDEQLRQRAEEEWEQCAAEMRARAKAKGITQEMIDEECMRFRYGS